MFARSLAALCCPLISALVFAAEPVAPRPQPVMVYLRTAPGQRAEPVKDMKQEAAALLAEAGYTLKWQDIGKPGMVAGNAHVVVLELKGLCQAPEPTAQLPPLDKPASLATTAVSDGHVLPFNYVECDTLSRLLMPALTSFGRWSFSVASVGSAMIMWKA